MIKNEERYSSGNKPMTYVKNEKIINVKVCKSGC